MNLVKNIVSHHKYLKTYRINRGVLFWGYQIVELLAKVERSLKFFSLQQKRNVILKNPTSISWLILKRNRTGIVIVRSTIEFLQCSDNPNQLVFLRTPFHFNTITFKKNQFHLKKNVLSHASPKSQSWLVSREL